jgi:hypothetical protein
MRRIEHLKLAASDCFDGFETPDWPAIEKLFGVSAPKRSDHAGILTHNVIIVKRYYQRGGGTEEGRKWRGFGAVYSFRYTSAPACRNSTAFS